ncbi:class I SAM-dependent methyltransferase [Butyrivibrio sp. AE2032]|uniref:class I SAM-dependent methyltransferase n=1 Tax=Butyrivibrio sp. AE2032 TaxID=1458463 RepID=UPI0005528465|nr:methyltransferase domain-containing protein [Butyrivibrio sp. AE2032]
MKEKAIVFGVGNYFESKKEAILRKYDIVLFIDNRVKPGQLDVEKDGVAVRNPADICMCSHIPVLIMSVKFFEMWSDLKGLGIDDSRIRFGLAFAPQYNRFEEIIKDEGYVFYAEKAQIIIRNNERAFNICTQEELNESIREIYKDYFPEISYIQKLPLRPVSERYGMELGTAIDRVYIEKFLQKNADCIVGDIGEFASDNYIKRFSSRIDNKYIFHVNGWGDNVIQADFSKAEDVSENLLDCLICTQTIQFIFEIDKAVSNIYRVLKKGGTALVTGHGLAQLSLYDYRNWGEYWRFTNMSMKKLFEQSFGKGNVDVITYGNAKTAAAMIFGLCAESLDLSDFDYDDMQYPVVVGAVCRKV